ncbi:hypothetical protein ACI77O_12145 [Pseudomonas tritici]|uniref:hypothetical protein n=1 Tax=Pseudomonas tritici TaxID=2745518 RepID=UPI00387AD37D
MGWKTLKQAMSISHNVSVSGDSIVIGSGYISALVSINIKTGIAQESETFPGFMRNHYPSLDVATPDELLALINTPDVFDTSITVYSFKGSEIVESQCEVPGYPNTTHTGVLMYENSHSTEKAVVIDWAKTDAKLRATGLEDALIRLEREKAKMQADHAFAHTCITELEAAYPTPTQPIPPFGNEQGQQA